MGRAGKPGFPAGGYIRLGRGASYNVGDGQCGMLLSGSYPLV